MDLQALAEDAERAVGHYRPVLAGPAIAGIDVGPGAVHRVVAEVVQALAGGPGGEWRGGAGPALVSRAGAAVDIQLRAIRMGIGVVEALARGRVDQFPVGAELPALRAGPVTQVQDDRGAARGAAAVDIQALPGHPPRPVLDDRPLLVGCAGTRRDLHPGAVGRVLPGVV